MISARNQICRAGSSLTRQPMLSRVWRGGSNSSRSGRGHEAGRHFSAVKEIEYPPFVKHYDTLIDMQTSSCEIFKDNEFIGTWKGDNFQYRTYKQFGSDVDRFRTVLAQHGVVENDKVAIISNNREEWAVTYYAANGRGAQIVPLYEAQTESDWRFIINNSDAKLLVVANQEIYSKTLSYLGNDFPRLETILCMDADPAGGSSYRSLMDAVQSENIIAPVSLEADDLSAIVYTSGSTGNPKGVCLSHRNMITNVKGFASAWGEEMLGKASTRKMVCYLPWSHIFGLTCSLHACLGAGAAMALVPRREAVLESAELVQPTEMSSVPLLLNKIYAGVLAKVGDQSPLKQSLFHKAFAVARQRNELVEANKPVGAWMDLKFRIVDRVVMSKIRSKLLGGKLEFFSAGGGKASMQVLQFFEDVGVPICEGYGMTEAAPVITMSISPGFARRRLGSVGKPLLGVGLQIRHPDTLALLDTGVEGEVCVSGQVIASGYYKNDKATAETFLYDEKDNYRYLRTGDLGHVDAEGFLTISGRIKEQYKLQNGKFVSPSPVEDYISRSVYISQVAVFGDHQEYNIALIVPDMVELNKWAVKHDSAPACPTAGSSPSEIEAFLQRPEVVELINADLRKYASDLKRYEYVQRWVFLNEPFSPENNMLTQKMSMKRHNVSKVYADLITSIYSGEVGNQVCYK